MKPVLELVRLEENAEHGTFGILKIQKEVFCCTLELPDLLNVMERSCIPAQQYVCVRYNSPSFGETFFVAEVPGRTNILFHAGNIWSNTKGCILLGQYWGKLGHDRAILNSGGTFRNFMKRVKDHDRLSLTISEFY